eukprot:CAMPEP_0170078678 /NCGR_PEP_ID=MMETSP0019_2-20121128/15237_1 /TAXON_ID=98059 /ORGANISM="Dinobryon sp., Strain UTEXLB2267" /LENGTH=331 /DNA_ID=CAMNT_0010291731 /DNA_START=1499 /DNA_END=2494 /DNA_ORIENTATION=+
MNESPLNYDDFLVCIRIMIATTDQVALKLSCLQSSQRAITLRNMRRGEYTVYLQLQPKFNTDSSTDMELKSLIMSKSEVSLPLQVSYISELLPTLNLPSSLKEYATNAETSTADVTLSYRILGLPSAVSQVQTCLQVIDGNTNALLLKSTCVPREHTEFTLSRMKAGKYKALLTLRNELDPSKSYENTTKAVEIDIRPPVEFTPSYNWQPLHAWHTIPSGIETRLPVGGEGHKEARIPNPWKLQIAMPHPCKYFLRMDLLRDSTMDDISKRASNQCVFQSECFMIQVLQSEGIEMNADNYITLPGDSTVEDTNFFSSEKRIILDPKCHSPS